MLTEKINSSLNNILEANKIFADLVCSREILNGLDPNDKLAVHYCSTDLTGLCALSATAVTALLNSHGIKSSIVLGHYHSKNNNNCYDYFDDCVGRNLLHCWSVVDTNIIDLTCSQFGKHDMINPASSLKYKKCKHELRLRKTWTINEVPTVRKLNILLKIARVNISKKYINDAMKYWNVNQHITNSK